MLQTYLTAILLIAFISGLWLLVQRLWRRYFPEYTGDDALADRTGCHNCNCGAGDCRDPNSNQADTEAR